MYGGAKLTSPFSQATIVPQLTSPQIQYRGSSGSTASSAFSVSFPCLAPFFGAAFRFPTLTLPLPSSAAVTNPGAGRRFARVVRGAVEVEAAAAESLARWASTTLARRFSRRSRTGFEGGSADAALPVMEPRDRGRRSRSLVSSILTSLLVVLGDGSTGVSTVARTLPETRRGRDWAAVG